MVGKRMSMCRGGFVVGGQFVTKGRERWW
jgi:hypothetical protein